MAEAKILRIYLDPDIRDMAEQGEFGFVSRVTSAFQRAGFRVELKRNTFEERVKSAARRGYSLFLMDEPFHARALTMRRAYYYPFWRIENTAKRWEFSVAQQVFDPEAVDQKSAAAWVANWRQWLFKNGPARREVLPLVYVPLQGRLFDHRSFQSMSPMEMIADVQARAGNRRIVLGLHPGEVYEAAERETLDRLTEKDARVTVQVGGMDEALRSCDLVVTQNSSVALNGFFFEKPAVLYGEADFHHQMPKVSQIGAEAAWAQARGTRPDFARYLYWFVALNAIKADEADRAETQIVERCQELGWDV